LINELVKGRTYLHYACDFGQLQIIQYLISKSANINIEDKYGIAPLLAAIWENHTNCVKYLIEKVREASFLELDFKNVFKMFFFSTF
jgi:ankyrin repeat protein